MIILQQHIDYLKKAKLFTEVMGDFKKTWFYIGKSYDIRPLVQVEPYIAQFASSFMTLGAFSYSSSNIGVSVPTGVVSAGRYCAIGGTVGVLGTNHPVNRIGLSGFDYTDQAPFAQFARDRKVAQLIRPVPPELNKVHVVIDDDVWIGTGVLLARRLHIGQGAVIGARSIVTKDVPPYAFVAGAPARIKRYRFRENVIERLLTSRWTDYAFTDFAHLPTENPERFLDEFERLKASGKMKPHPRRWIDLHREFLKISRLAARGDLSLKSPPEVEDK